MRRLPPLTHRLLAYPAGPPARLGELMSAVEPAKQRSIIQHMARDLLPILEKGLVDPHLLHRRARSLLLLLHKGTLCCRARAAAVGRARAGPGVCMLCFEKGAHCGSSHTTKQTNKHATRRLVAELLESSPAPLCAPS